MKFIGRPDNRIGIYDILEEVIDAVTPGAAEIGAEFGRSIRPAPERVTRHAEAFVNFASRVGVKRPRRRVAENITQTIDG